jgi:hypothetical protein
MNNFYKNSNSFIVLLTCLVFTLNTVSAQNKGQKIYTYNEFTGAFYLAGTSKTTGGATFSNVGTLQSVLNGGKFLGVSDGALSFIDPTGTVESYNWLTGIGYSENIPTTLLPSKGTTVSLNDEPHSGELVKNNPNFIDMGDDDLVYKDADGSLSSYYNLYLTGACPNGGQGYLLTDPTWTTFTGGPVAGQAPTKANIYGIEDGFIYTLGAAGDNNYHYYLYATGAYVGITNLGFPTFFGGPLNGVTPRAAMTNTVSGITYLGGAGLNLVFYQASPSKIIWYNRNNLFQADLGTGATTFADNIPGDAYIPGQTLASDVLGTNFIGVGDAEINFLDATGHLEWYAAIGGLLNYEADMSILRGPQAGNAVNSPNFIDMTDNGYSFFDADSTISWYNITTNTVWHDANWTKFTGGSLDGQTLSRSKIVATEEGYIYVLEPNGSLHTYNICDGKPWPADLWTYTTLTNGPLAGANLSAALKNQIPGARFLGVSNDELVFAIAPSATLTSTPPTCNATGANNNGLITISATSGIDAYGVSTGSSYAGPAYPGTGLVTGVVPQNIVINAPNAGATYTIRLFNGDNNTYCDTTITIAPVVCCDASNTVLICAGESYELKISDPTLTNVQWFKDGIAISGATNLIYNATTIGSYTYTASNNTGCPVNQCCPIVIALNPNCCLPKICVPILVKINK